MSGINGFLKLAVMRQNIMYQYASDVIEIDESSTRFFQQLFNKYNRSHLKKAVAKKVGAAQKKSLALKARFSTQTRVNKLQT